MAAALPGGETSLRSRVCSDVSADRAADTDAAPSHARLFELP